MKVVVLAYFDFLSMRQNGLGYAWIPYVMITNDKGVSCLPRQLRWMQESKLRAETV